MPNWCEVDVRFEGEQAKIDELLAFMGCNEDPAKFDIGRLVRHSVAPERSDTEESRWEWYVRHLGVGWRPSNVTRSRNMVSFQTPWTYPKVAVWRKLQAKFPDVSIWVEYFEHGMSFCGGFALLTKARSFADDWKVGKIERRWKCSTYRGKRGG